MHRIYADRINSRGMSRVFCDLRSQKTPRGILPVNSKFHSTKMENASELEAPRMSIQTKDLIRYNNHTTYYNKNHSKFIQKSQHHSTANPKETQPFLPGIQRSADASSHSRKTTQPNIHTQTPEQPPSPTVLKNQPVRRPYFNQKKNSNEPQIHHCSPLIF